MVFDISHRACLKDNPIPLGHKKFDTELLTCFFKLSRSSLASRPASLLAEPTFTVGEVTGCRCIALSSPLR